MAVWSCRTLVSPTPPSCWEKCSLRHFTYDLGIPVSFPAVQIPRLPLHFPFSFILVGSSFFPLLSLTFTSHLSPTHYMGVPAGLMQTSTSNTCSSFEVLLWLKGSHKPTTLCGLYSLWVHQRSVGKHKSTTCSTQLPKGQCLVFLLLSFLFHSQPLCCGACVDMLAQVFLQVCTGNCGHCTHIVR